MVDLQKLVDDYPRTLREFEDRFANEEACREYLLRLRWPEGFHCPQCDHHKGWETDRGLYHCAACGIQTSLTAGTIFQDSKQPLWVWFRATWQVTSQKSGLSALGLQRVLGLGSYRTAWLMSHKLRRAMVRPGRDRLAGTVEVDETFIGGPKPGKRGRGAAGKTLVLIAAQQDGPHIGRIRLHRISDASATSLERAVQGMVEPGSTVRTDGWRGYNGLKENGYLHQVVREDPYVGENLLPLANRVASLLKRWILGTHQGGIRAPYLEDYLNEFTFRFNRRTSRARGMLFYRLIQQALQTNPKPMLELKRK